MGSQQTMQAEKFLFRVSPGDPIACAPGSWGLLSNSRVPGRATDEARSPIAVKQKP